MSADVTPASESTTPARCRFHEIVQALRWFGDGGLRTVRTRVGTRVVVADGRSYVVFRETEKAPQLWGVGGETAVLLTRFRLRGLGLGRNLRHAVFQRLCTMTAPFFAGTPGFRRKLWLVDPATGEYGALYEWDRTEDARTYGHGLSRILASISFGGSVSYEVVSGCTIPDYLAEAAMRSSAAPPVGGEPIDELAATAARP